MLRDREGDVEKGVPINPKVGRVTFEEAATDFLNDYEINHRKTYKNALRRTSRRTFAASASYRSRPQIFARSRPRD